MQWLRLELIVVVSDRLSAIQHWPFWLVCTDRFHWAIQVLQLIGDSLISIDRPTSADHRPSTADVSSVFSVLLLLLPFYFHALFRHPQWADQCCRRENRLPLSDAMQWKEHKKKMLWEWLYFAARNSSLDDHQLYTTPHFQYTFIDHQWSLSSPSLFFFFFPLTNCLPYLLWAQECIPDGRSISSWPMLNWSFLKHHRFFLSVNLFGVLFVNAQAHTSLLTVMKLIGHVFIQW